MIRQFHLNDANFINPIEASAEKKGKGCEDYSIHVSTRPKKCK